MGDRVSIQYGSHREDGTEQLSAVLKHHWGGPEFAFDALEFARIGIESMSDNKISTPLSRGEPSAVMVSLVGQLVSEYNARQREHSLRLVPTPNDCDNSDNGHFIVWLDTMKVERR